MTQRKHTFVRNRLLRFICCFWCGAGRSGLAVGGCRMTIPINQTWTGKKIVEARVDLSHDIKTLGITNVSQSTVCFRIQTYEHILEYMPNKGTIPTAKSMDVEIKELKKGALTRPGGALNLHVVAMTWPSSEGCTFDSKLWKQMEARHESNQVISFGQVPTYTGIVDAPIKPKSNSPREGSRCSRSPLAHHQKKLVDVEPSKLSFKTPSSTSQTLTMTLKNVATHVVAVKMQTNKKQLYTVKPGKGVIPIGTQLQISVEAKVTPKDLEDDKERHVICVIAVPWPSPTKEFDQQEFQKIEEDRKKVQKMLLDVHFKGHAVSASGKYMDAEPLRLTYGPPFLGQIATVTLKNKGATPVAYKMQTNRQMLYSVHPNRGVVKAGCSEMVKIQILKTINQGELFDKTDAHQFQLMAAPWPTQLATEFDPAQWATLEAQMKGDIQKDTIHVQLSS